ncbi:MAG: helix-turn-helix domain-containing protein [Myxococcota bacterium]
MTHRGARSGCPIHLALNLLGDPWTLLVVRDLMFKGRHTFSDFLGAEEHIATNVLTDRLRRLEGAGLITRRPDPDDARRHRYHLTRAGISLAPVLVDLVVWSADHLETDAPPEVVHAMRHHRDGFLADLLARWEQANGG